MGIDIQPPDQYDQKYQPVLKIMTTKIIIVTQQKTVTYLHVLILHRV